MKRILIVEDDLAFGTMIQTWLKKKGFDVERVTSVGAAIKAMGASDAFHLVLSDLRLPDHDGLVLLQHIRKTDAHLPFIVMGSHCHFPCPDGLFPPEAHSFRSWMKQSSCQMRR